MYENHASYNCFSERKVFILFLNKVSIDSNK